MDITKEEIEQCLRTAGWYPGRQVNTKPVEEFYRGKGYPIFPNVMEFLSEYGNLKFLFEYPSVVGTHLVYRDYVFDPMYGSLPAKEAFYGYPEPDDAFAGTPLMIVGAHYVGGIPILMDQFGRLYMEMGGGREDIHLGAESIEAFVADLVARYIYASKAVQIKPRDAGPR